MKSISQLTLQEFLQHPLSCRCGRTHATAIKTVRIGSGALQDAPEIVRQLGWQRVFIIADINTYAAAGQALHRQLTAAGIHCSELVFTDPDLVPDERAVGSIVMRFDSKSDGIIAVGAGTINDISRFISFRLGLPYVIVATAPSMDGYASTVAPLITNNLKTTYEANMPQAIIADLDVLAKAPQDMIAAGFADILGKYTCLVDWKLSSIITGEYYCETVAEMMRTALERTTALQDKLAHRDKEALHKLMEALVLAGVAMSYVGNSRPASGSEHHLSHFWEMRYLFQGKKPVLHGTKVGIACRLILKLYDYLRAESLTAEHLRMLPVEFDYPAWEQEIIRAYGKAAPEVLQLEQKAHKNRPDQRHQRLLASAEHWAEIQDAIQNMPSAKDLAARLESVKGAAFPHEVGLTAEDLWDGIVYGKELRARYTILQLLWDLGLLHKYADRLAREEFPTSAAAASR